jgi:hypothetical protein
MNLRAAVSFLSAMFTALGKIFLLNFKWTNLFCQTGVKKTQKLKRQE